MFTSALQFASSYAPGTPEMHPAELLKGGPEGACSGGSSKCVKKWALSVSFSVEEPRRL
jgi:hypothetical protein